jgi:hypothetical protein
MEKINGEKVKGLQNGSYYSIGDFIGSGAYGSVFACEP